MPILFAQIPCGMGRTAVPKRLTLVKVVRSNNILPSSIERQSKQNQYRRRTEPETFPGRREAERKTYLDSTYRSPSLSRRHIFDAEEEVCGEDAAQLKHMSMIDTRKPPMLFLPVESAKRIMLLACRHAYNFSSSRLDPSLL